MCGCTMRKVVIGAAVLVAGATVLAQSDQTNFKTNNIWLSEQNFAELEGFENALILNTTPRMILVKKQGETMLCPMPATPDGQWLPCWAASD